jgi:D-alanine-D-alanine ligase
MYRVISLRNLQKLAPLTIEELGLPLVAKPVTEGNGVGLHFCTTDSQLFEALDALTENHTEVLVEQYTAGIEVTVPVLGNGEMAIALTPLEVDLHGAPIYTQLAKAEEAPASDILPARCNQYILDTLRAWAKRLHQRLGCAGTSRVDFRVIQGSDQISCLEINGAPNLGPDAHLAMCAAYDGIDYDSLIRIILSNVTVKDNMKY